MKDLLYTSQNKSFKHHVHPSLQKRLRAFVFISFIMIILVIVDIAQGTLSYPLAILSLAIGAVVGLISSRIFHLTWSHDGKWVIGQIDTTGWIVLAAYIAFEIARNYYFQSILHTTSSTTAITFAFVASALFSRAVGLRGKILRIIKEEKVF